MQQLPRPFINYGYNIFIIIFFFLYRQEKKLVFLYKFDQVLPQLCLTTTVVVFYHALCLPLPLNTLPSSCVKSLFSKISPHKSLFILSQSFLVLSQFRRKKTFSAVGFGHDNIPFLSTQHNTCMENRIVNKIIQESQVGVSTPC